MKTIVIIENEKPASGPLANLFKQWQQKTKVLTVTKVRAAINILSKQQVDLVIVDLAIPDNNGLDGLSELTRSFPYIPCIAITDRQKSEQSEAIERGAGYCLEKPIDNEEFLRLTKELLDTGTRGTVKGIPIHSFLQMLESEEKTCTLQVN